MDEKYRKQLDSIENLLKILVINNVAESLKNEVVHPEEVLASEFQLEIEKIKPVIEFFNAVNNLKSSEIIRSSKYTDDITEYLVSKFFEVNLCKSRTEIGYDGTYIGTKKRVQIKFHDGEKSGNIYLSDGDKKLLKDKKVEELIIMLGRNSNIKPSEVADIEYLFYKIPIKKVLNHRGGIGKRLLKEFEPVYKFNENFQRLN
jgi:hypothetical protein